MNDDLHDLVQPYKWWENVSTPDAVLYRLSRREISTERSCLDPFTEKPYPLWPDGLPSEEEAEKKYQELYAARINSEREQARKQRPISDEILRTRDVNAAFNKLQSKEKSSELTQDPPLP